MGYFWAVFCGCCRGYVGYEGAVGEFEVGEVFDVEKYALEVGVC